MVFADGADKTSQTTPFSFFDGSDPENLWDYLAAYETGTGGRGIAIPHNGNMSNGLMFSDKTPDGKPLTRAYAEKRIRWEPLHEMSQIKGDEEAHPLLSPEDEFADFENWDVGNLSGTAAKEESMLQYEYARSALKLGLQLGKEPVGNTVDIATATFTNTIGDSLLEVHWQDPEFDPAEPAFYYVRVLEIPTPRWTTYDAAFFEIPLPGNVPATLQDRAYTSPIWYTP